MARALIGGLVVLFAVLFGLLFVFVAFGEIEKLQAKFVRRAHCQGERDLERRPADVGLSRNGAPKLKPDMLVVAVNMNRVSRVDGKLNGSRSFRGGHNDSVGLLDWLRCRLCRRDEALSGSLSGSRSATNNRVNQGSEQHE